MKRTLALILITVLMLAGMMPAALADTAFSSDPDRIEQMANSVLMLEVYDKRDNMIATGSGFAAFDSRTLVTNYHVIEDGAYMVANTDDGEQYYVRDVCVGDKTRDIAICRFYTDTEITPLELRTDGTLKRGQHVVAIGSPIGITNTVSMGNISAVYVEDGVSTIQFTAPISHGSSGGALFDDEGFVIGMTSATYEDAQNINLAVHASEIRAMYDSWNGATRSIADFLKYGPADKAAAPTPTPAPTAPPKSKPDNKPKPDKYTALKKGDKGENVRRLQQALIELGYLQGKADGVFGTKTGNAVRSFELNNLAALGISDEEADSVADNAMQILLFDGAPKAFLEPDFIMQIREGAYAEWDKVSRDEMAIRFEVTNEGSSQTVTSFEMYVYAVDVWGRNVFGRDVVYYWSTEGKVAPGETVYSDDVILPDWDKFDEVCCGIHSYVLEDGTKVELPDEDVEYLSWEID